MMQIPPHQRMTAELVLWPPTHILACRNTNTHNCDLHIYILAQDANLLNHNYILVEQRRKRTSGLPQGPL